MKPCVFGLMGGGSGGGIGSVCGLKGSGPPLACGSTREARSPGTAGAVCSRAVAGASIALRDPGTPIGAVTLDPDGGGALMFAASFAGRSRATHHTALQSRSASARTLPTTICAKRFKRRARPCRQTGKRRRQNQAWTDSSRTIIHRGVNRAFAPRIPRKGTTAPWTAQGRTGSRRARALSTRAASP